MFRSRDTCKVPKPLNISDLIRDPLAVPFKGSFKSSL